MLMITVICVIDTFLVLSQFFWTEHFSSILLDCPCDVSSGKNVPSMHTIALQCSDAGLMTLVLDVLCDLLDCYTPCSWSDLCWLTTHVEANYTKRTQTPHKSLLIKPRHISKSSVAKIRL